MGYPNRSVQRKREPVGATARNSAFTAPRSHSECGDSWWTGARSDVGARIRDAPKTLVWHQLCSLKPEARA